MNDTSIMKTVLEIVDEEMFPCGEQEANLGMTWEYIDTDEVQRRRIAAALRERFPEAEIAQKDAKLFGYDVSLGCLCEELSRRVGRAV